MLPGRIYQQARETPDKTALFADGQAISYRAFATFIDRTRGYLTEQGLPADGVAILPTGSNATVWILALALRSLGLTTLAIPSGGSLGRLGLAEARCVVAVSGEHPPGLDRLSAAAGLRFIDVPTEIYAGAAEAPVPEPPDPAIPFGGHILLTSGTTGAYKKVLRHPADQEEDWEYRRRVFGITDRSVVNVLSLGCWAGAGHNYPIATWDTGGTVAMYQQAKIWNGLRVPGTTHCFVFPQLLSEILPAPAEELDRQDSMQLIVTGGPLSQIMAEAAKARLTARLYTSIGATEASTYTLTPIESPEDLRWHRVIPSRKVEVVDEQGRVLAAGENGLLRVDPGKGITGYLHDAATTRLFFRDGFFYPGDLAIFRADGRFALQGRVTDVINLLGQKIASRPVEEVLERELDVSAVCVFSAQNERAEEEIRVAIETDRPIEETRITPLLRRQLPGAPAFRVRFFPAFPRNEMGKVRRLELCGLIGSPATGAKLQ
jgi:acyl-coenzyme A synthetase/AMP-(fatty) acid ligase